jgi:hypothetical protein
METAEDVQRAIREAAIDKRNLAIDGGEYLVKDGKITDAGSELIDRIHMEGARVDTEAQWAAKGTATKGALDDAVNHMKPAQTATPTTETLDHAVEYFDRTLRPTRGTMVHTDEEIEGLVEEAIRKAQSGMPKEKADQIAKEVSDAIWDAQRKQVALRDASIERHNANMAANWQKYHEDDVYRHAGWEHLDLPPEEKEFLGKLIEKRAAEGGELLHPKQGTVLDGVALVEDGKLTKVGEIIAPDMKGKIPSSNTTGIREIPEPRKWDGWFDGGRDMNSVAEEAISKARRKAFAETMPTPKVELSEKQLAFLREHGTYGPEESVEAFKWLKEYSEVYKHGWDDKRIARMLTEGPWPGEGWRLEGRTLEGIKEDIAFKKMLKSGLLDPEHPIRPTPIRAKPTIEELDAAKEMLGKKIWEATSKEGREEAALLLRARSGTATKEDLIHAIEQWDGAIERAKTAHARSVINTLFEPVDAMLRQQPSVARTARAIDRLNGEGLREAGRADWRTIAGVGVSGSLLATLGFIGAGDSDGGHDYHVTTSAGKPQAAIVEGNPNEKISLSERYMNLGTPENPVWYDKETGERTDFNPNVHPDKERHEPDLPNNPAAAERAAAKVEAAQIMAEREAEQPPAPAPAPRPERQAVEPSAEEIERVRAQAGHGYEMTANDLQRGIDNLVRERDSILAKEYEVPVPEMRPTEYQNIQKVRAAAAAKPGATSTSIIAAVNKAQKQNSDVAKLKADLKRARAGARNDKQREKAEQEILREYNREYFDAIEKNATNEKLSAKRLQKIIDQLPRLEERRDSELGKKERAEERAEERLRREKQREADREYRDQLSQWRDSERTRREQERNQRREYKDLARTIRQENKNAETKEKKAWRAAMAGDKTEFMRWMPDGDWDSAQRSVRSARSLATRAAQGWQANPALNIHKKASLAERRETWRIEKIMVPSILYGQPVPRMEGMMLNRRRILDTAIAMLAV